MLSEVKLYYRDDVGDAEHPFEASCDVYDGAGKTPGDAFKALAGKIAAATAVDESPAAGGAGDTKAKAKAAA